MTQSTHSSVVDYRRRNKYYILPPDFETSKKCINHGRAERWGATAGYGINSHPTPGSLFAMGWSRSLSKGIVRFFKSAKKKNYLLMASILFYFLLRLSLIASETITLHPPCDACRPPVLLQPSPVAPVCFWLVVECNCVVYWAFKAATYFFPLFFVDQFDGLGCYLLKKSKKKIDPRFSKNWKMTRFTRFTHFTLVFFSNFTCLQRQ